MDIFLTVICLANLKKNNMFMGVVDFHLYQYKNNKGHNICGTFRHPYTVVILTQAVGLK